MEETGDLAFVGFCSAGSLLNDTLCLSHFDVFDLVRELGCHRSTSVVQIARVLLPFPSARSEIEHSPWCP